MIEYKNISTFIDVYQEPEKGAEDELIKRFLIALSSLRENTNKIIFDYANRIQDVKNLTLLQSEIFSTRQKILEDNHLVLDKLISLRSRLKEIKKSEIERINTNVQVRYQSVDERNIVAGGAKNIIELEKNIEALTNYSLFLKDSMGGLDDMKYAIKNTIDINALLGAVPRY